MAISVDTAGTTTHISATVTSSATDGGIQIRHHGDAPAEVDLIDQSANPDIVFEATGNITGLNGMSIFQANNGIIEIIAGGNLTTGMSLDNSASEVVLYAGNNLTISDPITTTGTGTDEPGIYLGAGGLLDVQANITSSADIGLVAGVSLGTWDDMGDMPTALEASQVSLSSGGQLNLSSALVAAGKVGLLGPVVNIDGDGSAQAGDKLYAYTATDMTLQDGAFLEADLGIYLGFGGGDSTLYLNETTGFASAYIIGNTAGTESTAIQLDFLARSSGGVVIDGVETFTSAAGGSGFFNGSHGTPAVLGSSLLVTYGVVDTVTAAVTSTVASSTAPVTTTEALPVLASTDTATSGTAGTAGGGEDEFGDEEAPAESTDGAEASDENTATQKKAAQCRS
jgi:hypothetical protein